MSSSTHSPEVALSLPFDATNGFLPNADPLTSLPAYFEPWETLGANLPKHFASLTVREAIDSLPLLDASRLASDPEVNRGMVLLTYFCQAYVWGSAAPARVLPKPVAVPLFALAARVDRHPLLSYTDYVLHNWKRIDPEAPIALGNIAITQNFLGGIDEEWFILVHVEIEKEAAPAIQALVPAMEAARKGDIDALHARLAEIEASLGKMFATLERMPEFCDPYIYYRRVRPYIHGWKDNPALPEGLVYEGVEEFHGEPQRFRGQTGAQSSIIPAIDATLQITHKDDPLRHYLNEMREYMPAPHRELLALLEANSTVRSAVEAHPDRLSGVYDRCVEQVHRFRALHLEYAATYVNKQSQDSSGNPVDIGTGGTPFMKYLKKHRDETEESKLRG